MRYLLSVNPSSLASNLSTKFHHFNSCDRKNNNLDWISSGRKPVFSISFSPLSKSRLIPVNSAGAPSSSASQSASQGRSDVVEEGLTTQVRNPSLPRLPVRSDRPFILVPFVICTVGSILAWLDFSYSIDNMRSFYSIDNMRSSYSIDNSSSHASNLSLKFHQNQGCISSEDFVEEGLTTQVVNPILPMRLPSSKLSLSDRGFFLLAFIACTAMGGAVTSLSKLVDTAREEHPRTMAAIRLSGMKISNLTGALSDSSQEITDGVNKAAQAVQAAEAGTRQIGTHA